MVDSVLSPSDMRRYLRLHGGRLLLVKDNTDLWVVKVGERAWFIYRAKYRLSQFAQLVSEIREAGWPDNRVDHREDRLCHFTTPSDRKLTSVFLPSGKTPLVAEEFLT